MSNTTEELIPAGGVQRRSFLKALGAIGVVGAGSSLLAACGTGGKKESGSADSSTAASGGSAKEGGEIVAYYAFTVSGTMDPLTNSSAVGVPALWHTTEGVVDLGIVDRKPYAALAKEMPTQVDDVTWKATLRDGAKFHDGSAVTAEDVAWSFTRVLDPANSSLLAPFLAFLKNVEATDDKTVTFNLNYPYADFLELISVVKVVPKALTDTAEKAKEYATLPVGSGPYKFKSITNALIELEKNPDYNGPRKAYADKLTWNCTTEGSARVSALQSGGAQAIQSVPTLNAEQLKQKAKVADEQGFNFLFLMFNCEKAPFNDVRVRQALFYALNIDQLIKVSMSGFATGATCYLDDGKPGYQKASTVYTYDPDKAKQLLQEAGVSDLSFTLDTTDNAIVKAAAPVIQDNWKAVGVNVTINTQASSAIYQTYVPADNFTCLAASGDPSIYGNSTDLLLRWYYASETWMSKRARFGSNPKYTELKGLMDSASQEQDEAKRKSIYKQIFDIVAEEVPIYPVFHTKNITGWAEDKLAGFKPSPTNALGFLDVGLKG